jgi:hypothetical protein
MVAWPCSNPGILTNEQAIGDFFPRQASALSFDAEALRASLKALFYILGLLDGKIAGSGLFIRHFNPAGQVSL